MKPSRDTADVLDYRTGEKAIGSKLAIDATKKLHSEGFKRLCPLRIKTLTHNQSEKQQ